MKKLLDADHPFFAPVWRRWVTVIFPFVWGGVEFYLGSPGWALIFGAAAIWAFWELILKAKSGSK